MACLLQVIGWDTEEGDLSALTDSAPGGALAGV